MKLESLAQRGRPAPWLYLFGVIVWTWAFLGIAAMTGQSLLAFPTVILSILGGLGPIIVSATLISVGYWDPALDRTALGFLGRVFDPRTLPWRWYSWITGLVIILAVLPVLLDAAGLPEQGLLDVGPGLFLIAGLLGALEEPGWRGYAQEALQRRLPVVVASLIIGVFWAAWHLPLFFIADTYQAGLGVGTAAFWAFHLALIVGSPVYAWLYNAAGRVPFAAVLYHALGNLARELVPDVSNVAEVGVEALIAVVVILAAWSLMRVPRPPASAMPKGARAEDRAG